MKIKSYAMHQIDINDYASTEHWYYTYHGPQLLSAGKAGF